MATCQEVISKARILLRDTDVSFAQHSDETLLGWLADGQTAVVVYKPSANTRHIDISLVPGADQTLPDDALYIVRPLSNVTVTQSTDPEPVETRTPGRTITAVDPDTLYRYVPDWPTMDADSTVQHVLLDENEPVQFQVYPPQPDPAGVIKVAAVINPPAPANISENIAFKDEYQTALIEYVCYRALLEDSDNPVNAQKSEMYYSKFMQSLGVQYQAQMALRPVRKDYMDADEYPPRTRKS